MPSLPRISLVTPSLNQSRFIRSTIESVLSQGYPDLEYAVQDGGSSDGTVEILDSYAGRIQVVCEKDRGQADAVNRGLRRATGEVLGYLNSDDVLLPGALLAIGEAFSAQPRPPVVFGRAVYIDAHGMRLAPYVTAPDAFARLGEACFLAQPATFWTRRVRDEVGELDETLHYAMDYDYWFRIAARYGPAAARYRDGELAAARLHDGAKSVAAWDRALDEIIDLVERRAGYVSLWWTTAKWSRRLGSRGPAGAPRRIPWLAYAPAGWEFLRRNPARLWRHGLNEAARHVMRRAGA